MRLGAPTNAVRGTSNATGTIVNDDPFPRIAVSAGQASVPEGTGAGVTEVAFRLTIDRAPVGLPASVQLSFVGAGSQVVVGTDCTDPRTDVAVPMTTRRVDWPVGTTAVQQTFTATVCRDGRDDDDVETFHALLGGFERALNDGPVRADVAIQDDDAAPTVSVVGSTVTEPASAGTTTRASVTLQLSAPSNRPIPVVVTTREAQIPAGTLEAATIATVGSACGQTVATASGSTTVDFVRRFDAVTFAPGESTATFGDIVICHDGRSEGVVVRSNPGSPLNRNAFANMEQFEVAVSVTAGYAGVVSLGNAVARVVIRDN